MKARVQATNATRTGYPVTVTVEIDEATMREWLWDAIEKSGVLDPKDREEDVEYVLRMMRRSTETTEAVMVLVKVWQSDLLTCYSHLSEEDREKHRKTIEDILCVFEAIQDRVLQFAGKANGHKKEEGDD